MFIYLSIHQLPISFLHDGFSAICIHLTSRCFVYEARLKATDSDVKKSKILKKNRHHKVAVIYVKQIFYCFTQQNLCIFPVLWGNALTPSSHSHTIKAVKIIKPLLDSLKKSYHISLSDMHASSPPFQNYSYSQPMLFYHQCQIWILLTYPHP